MKTVLKKDTTQINYWSPMSQGTRAGIYSCRPSQRSLVAFLCALLAGSSRFLMLIVSAYRVYIATRHSKFSTSWRTKPSKTNLCPECKEGTCGGLNASSCGGMKYNKRWMHQRSYLYCCRCCHYLFRPLFSLLFGASVVQSVLEVPIAKYKWKWFPSFWPPDARALCARLLSIE